ncbi:putative CRISPR-associated protein Csy3 [Vibrio chagasii]|nr:putative CRISPR-associated protein Csy3 [Vibrio chagasii]
MSKAPAKPAILAYSRLLNTATAFMYSSTDGAMGNSTPLSVEQVSIRTVFGASNTKKEEAIEKAIAKPQIFRNDIAILPVGHDWLIGTTSLITAGNEVEPVACDQAEYREMLMDFSQTYIEQSNLEELALSYILNMITARWMWRNVSLAQEIRVTCGEYVFTPTPMDHSINSLPANQHDNARELATKLAKAVTTKVATKFSFQAAIKIGEGQEVFPSQAFVEDKNETRSRVLQTVKSNGVDQAILTPQKVGNALRWVDVWYEGNDDAQPLPVEVYGINRKMNRADRYKNKNHLFLLLDKLPQITEEVKQGNISGDAHYVMACLIRGGLYQQK